MEWWKKAAAAACALAAVYCADPDPSAPADSTCVALGEGGGSAHAVYYELSWNDDGVIETHDDGSWTTETDLGYIVRVDSGMVVNYSAQLVECEEDAMNVCTDETSASLWRRLGAGIPRAWAGHSTGESDPSAVEETYAQSLTSHETLAYGSALADPALYCRSHYLVGPLTPTTVGAPDDESLVGTTLWIEGSYTTPGAPDAVAFSLATTSAYGVFDDLASESGSLSMLQSGHASALVRIARPRGRMFDGIDLANEEANDAAKQVLRNLIVGSHTQIYIDAD
jgi:hypothetical protein